VLLARRLSPGDVGLFNLGMTISALIGLVIILGADRAIIRLVAKHSADGAKQKEIGAIYGVLWIVGVMLAAAVPILYLTADGISSWIFRKAELAPILKIFVLSLPFSLMIRLMMGVFQAYKRISIISLVEQVLAPVLKVLLLAFAMLLVNFSTIEASYSYLVATAIAGVVAVVIFIRFITILKDGLIPVFSLSSVLQASLPFFFVTLLNRTNSLTETLVLGALSSNDQIGLFTLNLKITVSVAVFMDAFSIIFSPFIAELYSKQDFQRLSLQLKTVTRWILTLTFPIATILWIKAADVMAVFGSEYLPGAPVLQTLVGAQLFYAVFGLCSLVLVMTDRTYVNMFDLALSLLLSLILDFYFIPRQGAMGAAIAGALTIVFVNLLRLVQVYWIFRITPFNRKIIEPLIAGVLASGIAILVTSPLRLSSPIGQLVVFAAINIMLYCSLLLIAWWVYRMAKTLHHQNIGER
jgi:O-antigen/teichoic acid export membrane protein